MNDGASTQVEREETCLPTSMVRAFFTCQVTTSDGKWALCLVSLLADQVSKSGISFRRGQQAPKSDTSTCTVKTRVRRIAAVITASPIQEGMQNGIHGGLVYISFAMSRGCHPTHHHHPCLGRDHICCFLIENSSHQTRVGKFLGVGRILYLLT